MNQSQIYDLIQSDVALYLHVHKNVIFSSLLNVSLIQTLDLVLILWFKSLVFFLALPSSLAFLYVCVCLCFIDLSHCVGLWSVIQAFSSNTPFFGGGALWFTQNMRYSLKYTEQKWKRYTWIVCHLYTKLCKPRMQMKVYLNVQILGNA